MAWTEEDKQKVIKMYKDASPTPETSTEIIKNIAEELDQSPNGIRMVLVQAGEYIKKDSSATTTKGTSKTEGTKRISKDVSLTALKKAIEDRGGTVDDEIIDKLTGKAAVYFTTVINSL